MAIEIERKFLIRDGSWRESVAKSTRIHQGYLSTDAHRNVRVRIKGERAMLTVKGKLAADSLLKRLEFEYEIPVEDAAEMLELCLDSPIDKTRHEQEYGGFLWEIDEFHGVNDGLVVAEIELPDEAAAFKHPAWLGAEVSEDPRYLNSNLVTRPFSGW